MALFELHDGGLAPARLGHEAGEAARREALDSVRHHVVEVLSAPLFPVCWNEAGTVLTALDPAGQVVAVEVIEELDPSVIVSSMAHLATVAAAGWAELANRYPGGLQTFREDWNEFRESMPARVEPGPRLIIVAARIADSVRSSLAMLASSGVELQLLSVREFSSGRRLVELQRVEPQTFSPAARMLASRRAAQPVLSGQTAVVNERAKPAADDAANSDDAAAASASKAQAPGAQADQASPAGAVASSRQAAPAAKERASQGASGKTEDPMEITLDAPDVSELGGASAGPREEAAEEQAGTPEATAPEAPQTPPGASDPATPVDGFARMSAPEASAALELVGSVLERDTPIVWQRLRRGIFHEAVLSPQGVITLADGRSFTDPSAAADAAQGCEGADGWHVWRFGVRGPSLREALEEVSGSRAGDGERHQSGGVGADGTRRRRRQ
ncbi:restriction system modified-DNA reader domain-containing protein [Actinomyces weissii]|uniref:RAMA domain-containing protein n=1 Tax=Actinomyces weissii TaxID=675090 RepID=A0A7T7S2N8_9ACTO|nr:hypothetical protein [Actinomyces weissii]QQM67634.1 hypothetical protein JG540_01740 [Actinomyces weissii]